MLPKSKINPVKIKKNYEVHGFLNYYSRSNPLNNDFCRCHCNSDN